MEEKICQKCEREFTIEADDFSFYEKIKVPPPTFCPECRMIRRFCFRNDRTLYKVKCDAPGHDESLISIFKPESSFPVYDHKFWWGDGWDPVSYGREYDFSKPFFEQFKELNSVVPLPNLYSYNIGDSEYSNYSVNSNNIYMSTSIADSEDIIFSMMTNKTKKAVDCLKVESSERVYEATYSYRLNNCCFIVNSHECIDSWFLYDCVNCQNCFMCSNLRNKKFCINNKQYSKEEYEKIIKEFKTGSNDSLIKLKQDFKKLIINTIHKFSNLNKTVNSTGDNITESKNSHNVFASDNMQNVKYSWRVVKAKDTYDIGGTIDSELIYEATIAGLKNFNSQFYNHCTASTNLRYSIFCSSGFNLFGCVGLKNKEYCILNKQYSKEEYEALVPKIIEHMKEMPYVDNQGLIYKFGEFFPTELSLFAYNETLAQEYFCLTKEEALKQGYKWQDRESRNYILDIKTEELADDIKNVNENMAGKIIECPHRGLCDEQCTEAFKIISNELQFYKEMNLPLPRFCPNCRHHQRLKQINPLRLWHRVCMCDKNNHLHGDKKCEVEFETSYAPDRPETVYCEKCYQQEVY